MNAEQLDATAQAMVAKGKGILAADESTGTMGKRLEGIGVAATEANRRDYREMLVSTKGAGESISGAILYDETLRQSGASGTSMVAHLAAEGILPGIKVDTGAKDLAVCPGEKITEGLDGLRETPRRVLRARRPVHQVARRDHDWRGIAEPHLHRSQCARPGALRRNGSRGKPRADRRA